MYYSIIILALSVVLSVSANVWNTYNVTFSTNATLTYFFEQKTADFSANNTYDVVLSATPASPEDFCSLLRDATPNSLGRLVLIKAVCCHYTTQPVPGTDCFYQEKAANAHLRGAAAVLIGNCDKSETPDVIPMGAVVGIANVHVPVASVSCGTYQEMVGFLGRADVVSLTVHLSSRSARPTPVPVVPTPDATPDLTAPSSNRDSTAVVFLLFLVLVVIVIAISKCCDRRSRQSPDPARSPPSSAAGLESPATRTSAPQHTMEMGNVSADLHPEPSAAAAYREIVRPPTIPVFNSAITKHQMAYETARKAGAFRLLVDGTGIVFGETQDGHSGVLHQFPPGTSFDLVCAAARASDYVIIYSANSLDRVDIGDVRQQQPHTPVTSSSELDAVLSTPLSDSGRDSEPLIPRH